MTYLCSACLFYIPLTADTDLNELGKARKRGEQGVPARSRFFLIQYKRFTWGPCLLVDYKKKTDTFVVEWPTNGARKDVKR
jgi:hypothetical protein